MKLTVTEFIEEYERMCAITKFDANDGLTDELGPDDLLELQRMVIDMFNENCGEVPNFELTDNGRKIKILGTVSNEDN